MKRALLSGVIPMVSVAACSFFISYAPSAHAACTFSAGAGDDAHVCDSGASVGGLTDISGNNSLTFPAGGTGTLNGDVLFGAGDDTVNLGSGTVNGDLDQGDGNNTFVISAGTITGHVQQGHQIDSFTMSGGQIQSLAQGDGFDRFLMTGGTIVGAFEDGDFAQMTGGTIGRVDMKLDDNVFDMSGGNILGNLVTGFGKDTIIVSGGTIGGNISVSGGDDSVTITGGTVVGEIRTSFGDDTFTWKGGGEVKSAILMGEGNDKALLSGLGESALASPPIIDGGLGVDALTFSAATSSGAARYTGWESISLTAGSRFNLGDTFTLGDSETGTGELAIGSGSVLAVTQGSVQAFTSGQMATVRNAGAIDMTAGSSAATDTLTIQGNYVGSSGQLNLQSVLAGDGSASDRLVVAQGSLSGTTQMRVSNLGGSGGLTTADGIQVVQTLNGATSQGGAFSLGSPVSAGAYEYYLFKGGVTAGTEESWYLRSSVAPAGPVTPVAASGTAALPAAGATAIPLYRPEVPVYAATVPAAQLMTLQTIGTFHDRQGEQSLLTETGTFPAGWGRVYGSQLRKSWTGTVSPYFDGSVSGYQVGHDLFASTTAGGQIQRGGLFVGQSRVTGDIKGFALGFENQQAGDMKLKGDNLGAYWTLTDPQGWYVDAVLMGTWLDGRSRSDRGVKLDTHGRVLSVSLEAGYALALSERWTVEPQVQVIGQRVSLDSQNDGVSNVSFDTDDYLTGRLGLRLKGNYQLANLPVEPYLRTNVWQTFGGKDTQTFNDADKISTEYKSSSADIGAGVVAQVSEALSVYLSADYNTHLDGNALEGFSGNAGLRMRW